MTSARRRLRIFDFVLSVAFCAAAPALPAAPSCDTATVPGTIEVGDGSRPPCDFVDLWAVPESGNWTRLGEFRWGAVTPSVPEGTWRFAVHACETYYPFRRSEPVRCARGKDGCVTCDGRFDLKMFGIFGGYSGQVTQLPSGLPAGPGVPVSAASGLSCTSEKFTYTDPQGHFILAPAIEPHRSNHWGLTVDGDGSGPGSRGYFLTADVCENGVAATTYSSVDVMVNLYRAAPYMTLNDPSSRPIRFPPLLPVAPPQEIERGISLTTGNVFLDQADVAAWGGSADLSFVRSYNSRAAAAKIEGTLGPGWTHSYDAQVTSPEPRVLMVREDDGTVLYFADADGNGSFRASVPILERSRVVKTPGGFERHFPEGARDVFSAAGRLVQRIDAGGRVTRIVRDNAGLLTSVVDPDGHRLAFGYGPSGRLLKLSSGNDLLVSYAYDASNRLQKVTHSDGTGFAFTYDAAGQLLSVADLGGQTLRTYTYVNNKARSYETAAGQDRVTVDYGALKTVATDALGRATSYEWTNAHGIHLVTSVSGPCPACGRTGSPLDPMPRPPTLPVPSGTGLDTRPAWARLLDPPWPLRAWPVAPAVDWTAAPLGVSEQQSWTYDLDGRLVSYGDRSGRTFYLSYDAHGDPATLSDSQAGSTRFSRDASGRVTAVRAASTVDPQRERATLLTYDEKGRLISRVESGLTTQGSPLQLTTRLTYDDSGRLVRVESPPAGSVSFAYDPTGNLSSVTDGVGTLQRFAAHAPLGYPTTVTDLGVVTGYTYGPLGRVLSRVESGETTAFAYTATGRLRQTKTPRGDVRDYGYDSSDRLIDEKASDRHVVHTYDKAGQRTSDALVGEQGGNERQRTLSYDGMGRLSRLAVPGGAQYDIGYDLAGRPESLHGPGAEAVFLYYDANGRLAGQRVLGVASVSYRYDTAGRLLSATDGQDAAYTYAYDDLGRLRSVATPAGGATSFEYDGAGHVVSSVDGQGITSTFDYDARGRLLHVRFPKDHSIDYAYDDCVFGQGRLCAAGDVLGRTLFGYDSHGRLIQETREAAGTRDQTSYAYDGNGDLQAIRYPSGRLVSYAWDGGFGPRSVSTSGPEGPLRVLANLTRAADGLLTGLACANGVTVSWTRDGQGRVRAIRGGPLDLAYTYDAQGNVSSVTSADKYQTFEYGPGRRLIASSGPGGTTAWSYDAAGDRLSASAPTGNTSFAYQPRTQRLLSTTGERSTVFSYDGAGRMLRSGENRFAYDEAGHLVGFGQDLRNVEYGYDYQGRRVSKTTREGTVHYHYDRFDHLIAESTADGGLTEYIYADDRPVVLVRAGLYFIHEDAARVPVALTGGNGQVFWQRQPRPFGDDPPSDESTILNLRAPGQYYDRETGLFHNGQRHYVPRLGRYLEPDPCAAPGTLSADTVYGYAAANPLAFVEPRGTGVVPTEPGWTVPADLWPALLRLPRVLSPQCRSAAD